MQTCKANSISSKSSWIASLCPPGLVGNLNSAFSRFPVLSGVVLWLSGFLQCPGSGTYPLSGVAYRVIPLHTLTWYQCTWETPAALFRKNKMAFRPWELKMFFTLLCGTVHISPAPTHKLQAQLCRSKSVNVYIRMRGSFIDKTPLPLITAASVNSNSLPLLWWERKIRCQAMLQGIW